MPAMLRLRHSAAHGSPCVACAFTSSGSMMALLDCARMSMAMGFGCSMRIAKVCSSRTLNCAGSSVSMSVSQATTSVRLSCASLRTGRTPALPRAAAPAEILRNDRRSMLTRASLVFDRFGGEEDGLGAVAIVLVQLADQLLPHRRRDVLLVLTHVADLDALDVAPRSPGGR